MSSLLFTLLVTLSAHADFVWVTYETKSYPNDACIDSANPGSINVDFVQAHLKLWEQARSFNLRHDDNYFGGEGSCPTKGSSRLFKISELFEGKAEDIRHFVANPPVYGGQYLSFQFNVMPIESVTAHYQLREKSNTEFLPDAVVRPVAGLVIEKQQFVEAVCHYPANDFIVALRGTANEAAAVAFLRKYDTTYQLQVELEMTPANGQPFRIMDSQLWACTGL